MADGKVVISIDLDGKKAQGDVKTLKSLLQGLGGTGSKVGSIFKSVLGANIVSSTFMGAISAAKSGITALMGEAVSASDTLYKFEQTMSFGGYDSSTIKQARADVKKYADETVYDIEDIANTTAQLASNGITNFKQLTESAGNLNAVAGGNANTFKTVGMVLTQTAGAGKLTTENWNQLANAIPGASGKLQQAMLEAGAYTGNFRQAMEDGEITADEFNAAIIALGESQKEAATSTATVEGAIGNFRATLSSGLLTIIDKIKPKITDFINTFTELAGKIDFDALAAKIDSGLEKVGQFFSKFSETGALTAAGQAFNDIGGAIGNLFAALGGGKGDWTDFGTTLGNIVTKISEAASAVSGFIANMDTANLQSWIATFASVIGGFKIFSAVTGSSPVGSILTALGNKFGIFGAQGKAGTDKAGSGTGLLSQLFQGLGTVITSVAQGISIVLQGLATAISTVAQGFGQAAAMASPAQWLSMGAAMLMVGAGVALASAGIYVLVQAAIQLTSAGSGAAIALAGLGVGIAALAGIFALLGPALTAGAVGIVAFGAAVALIGAGVYAASAGLSMLAGHLPTIASHGASAAVGIAALGAGLAVVGAGAAVAGAGLMVAGAGLTVVGAGAVVATAGAIALGAGLVVASAGLTAFGTALNISKPGLTAFSKAATKVVNSISGGFVAILNSVSGVIDSIGNAALNAGKGFNLLATGVVKITDTKLSDMAASLTAVAVGVGAIAAQSEGLAQAGSGMSSLGKGMKTVSGSAMAAVGGLSAFVTRITSLSAVVTTLPSVLTSSATGFAGFATQAAAGASGLSAINAPISAFKVQIMTIAPALMSAGSGFASFGSRATLVSGALTMVSGIITAFNARIASISTALSSASNGFSILQSRAISVNSALMTVSSGFAQIITAASSSNAALRSISNGTQAVISAFSSMRSQVQSSLSAMLNVTRTVGNQMISQGRQTGQQTSQSLARGLSSGVGQVSSAMQLLNSTSKSVGMSGIGPMQSVGAMIGQGLAQGMYSALGSVTAAANALVYQAERAARAKAMIHSPSRLFRDKIGIFIGRGVAVGIDRSAKFVKSSMDGIYGQINDFRYKTAENILGVGKKSLSQSVQLKVRADQAKSSDGETTKNTEVTNQYTLNFTGSGVSETDKRDLQRLMKEMAWYTNREQERLGIV